MAKMEQVANVVEVKIVPHREGFDLVLPEDLKVFAFCDDDFRGEMLLMIYKEAA